MKWWGAAVVAVMVCAVAGGCTDTDAPSNPGASPSPGVIGSDAPAMTFEEAYQKLPMDGTKELPITWEPAGVPATEDLVAARRSLVFSYWLRSETDWTPIIPIGRFLFTDKHYQEVLAPSAEVTDAENPSRGPLWAKAMGVEETGPDEARVTFCTDRGYWRGVEDASEVRKDRANLESYRMTYVQTGDGERRWLTSGRTDNAVDREEQYGAQCTEWAQHQL
ncbi:hypothetical protein [Actinoplanes derwentensis]|uniref:hypothetical protein n=1 Tax=Actinoplanes derwentensis TaxID=113562 RepID=UPI001EF2A9A3|nr:hypothetical protein [Actinoplanes derwentensis]